VVKRVRKSVTEGEEEPQEEEEKEVSELGEEEDEKVKCALMQCSKPL